MTGEKANPRVAQGRVRQRAHHALRGTLREAEAGGDRVTDEKAIAAAWKAYKEAIE